MLLEFFSHFLPKLPLGITSYVIHSSQFVTRFGPYLGGLLLVCWSELSLLTVAWSREKLPWQGIRVRSLPIFFFGSWRDLRNLMILLRAHGYSVIVTLWIAKDQLYWLKHFMVRMPEFGYVFYSFKFAWMIIVLFEVDVWGLLINGVFLLNRDFICQYTFGCYRGNVSFQACWRLKG